MAKVDIKVGDVVAFNPYPEQEDREPSYGKVKRIGTHEELNIFSMWDNPEIIYELESLDKEERNRFIFTRTTRQWLNKVLINREGVFVRKNGMVTLRGSKVLKTKTEVFEPNRKYRSIELSSEGDKQVLVYGVAFDGKTFLKLFKYI